MADIYSKSKRSQIMASVSSKETKPEKNIRSFLFRQGFRFKKNVKDLPGKPDIVLPKYKTIIFIHGCFWHGHENCKKAARPTTNTDFWNTKIQSNIDRDEIVISSLKNAGWKIITIWECEIKTQKAFYATVGRLIDEIRSNR